MRDTTWRGSLEAADLWTIYQLLTNPAYGSAYAYGKSEHGTRYEAGIERTNARRKSHEQCLASIPGTHEGYVEWERFERVQLSAHVLISNVRALHALAPIHHWTDCRVPQGTKEQRATVCDRCARFSSDGRTRVLASDSLIVQFFEYGPAPNYGPNEALRLDFAQTVGDQWGSDRLPRIPVEDRTTTGLHEAIS